MLSVFELYTIVSQGLSSLWVTILTGGILAAGGWTGAYYFAQLWNRSFRLRLWHHLLCGMAAITTLVSVPVWVAASSVEYPDFAKKASIEGRVVVEFDVDENGDVVSLRVTDGSKNRLLRQSAIDAVNKLDCEPGMKNGESVEMGMKLPVDFELDEL